MKIAYDGRPFIFDWIEGMLVYNRQLIKRLASLFPDNQYHFYFNSLRRNFDDIASRIGIEKAYSSVLRIPTIGRDRYDLKLFFDIFLPRALKKDRIDLFHGLRYFVPPPSYYRVVTTFHDIFALTIPQYSPEQSNKVRARWYKRALTRSDKIIAASQSTKNDILKYYDMPEDKIRVVHLAQNDNFQPVIDQNTIMSCRDRYELTRPYILALGGPHARKNVRGLIQAYAQVKSSLKCDHQLIFFGGTANLAEFYHDEISRSGVGEDIRFIFPVPGEDLPAIYSMADVFVYPSLYEGFGIPVVEAMSCGTPVITSDISSMPEVAGGAALLVDPARADDIAEKIASVIENCDLQLDLSRKGLDQARNFSWEKHTRETMDVYREVVSG